MAARNTTLNLPEELIARSKAYAAARGTTVTALVRGHLEAVTRGAEPAPAQGALEAYAAGLLGRAEAIRETGVRDYAELLVALGDADLAPPRPQPHEVENQAVLFERVWGRA